MKTEVYNWRVSTLLKAELEREAHRRKISLAALLDEAALELFNKSAPAHDADKEQQHLHQAAAKCFGAFEGRDVHRSERATQKVRQRLKKRYGR